MKPKEFADRYLRPYKRRGDEIISSCPICLGGDRNDKDTFYLNSEKEVYECKRGKCGAKGTFSQLCKKFGEQSDQTKEWITQKKRERNYKLPSAAKDPTSKSVEYLALRKISKATIEKCKVGEDDKGNIVFRFYQDGKHVFNKYRPSHKVKADELKSWRDTDTKPVFYNMDNCDTDMPLIITEGEIDCLSVVEVGHDNAVSVPSGASDLSCIDNCYEWINQFKHIYIWVDNDQAGDNLRENLIQRLGKWRCFNIYSEEKDANAQLYKHGKESVMECVNNGEPVKHDGLICLSDVESIDYSEIKRIPSTFNKLNKVIGGYYMGMVTVLTGVNSSGKSTFLGNEMLNAIESGNPICVYSGELPARIFKQWIDLQACGKEFLKMEFDNVKQMDIPYVPSSVKTSLNNWYQDKFYLYDKNADISTDKELLEVFEYSFRRHGCRFFVVDNMMTTFFTNDETDYYRQQAVFVAQMKSFAERFNSHVIIVAHPRKISGIVKKEDISGSGHISDIADLVIGIHRLTDDEKEKLPDTDNLIQVLKNRVFGVIDKKIRVQYCEKSKRLYDPDNPYGSKREYGWIRL